jgi:ankyrin repeat protein
MCAVISNNVELVKLLLANDADPNIKNQYNQTPLERARKENRTEIIAILESPMIKSANKV